VLQEGLVLALAGFGFGGTYCVGRTLKAILYEISAIDPSAVAVVAFQRLQRGLIRSEWKASENSRRAKYCVLTDQLRKRLNRETQKRGRQVAAIARILEAS
jgi:PadR family transcriptional regulator, regulatory protein PadR